MLKLLSMEVAVCESCNEWELWRVGVSLLGLGLKAMVCGDFGVWEFQYIQLCTWRLGDLVE